MKKCTIIVQVFLFVLVLLFNNAHALRFSGGPKWADDPNYNKSPHFGIPAITKIECKNGNKKSDVLSFEIGFDKEAKKIDAFWSKLNDDESENREGIKIVYLGHKRGEYSYRVTLDMNAVKKETGKIETPVNLTLGCYHPKSGYPNLRDVRISWDNKIPKNKRIKCPKINRG